MTLKSSDRCLTHLSLTVRELDVKCSRFKASAAM